MREKSLCVFHFQFQLFTGIQHWDSTAAPNA